jgi:hypothetical protein
VINLCQFMKMIPEVTGVADSEVCGWTDAALPDSVLSFSCGAA